MEAPEKIYFDESDVRGVLDTYQYKFPHDIFEYVRKDAYIEKACAFLETYPHMFFGVLRSDMIEDFKKYMEG